MRILLADEDAMIGDRVRSALKHEGFAVDWVRDGRAADRGIARPSCRAMRRGRRGTSVSRTRAQNLKLI